MWSESYDGKSHVRFREKGVVTYWSLDIFFILHPLTRGIPIFLKKWGHPLDRSIGFNEIVWLKLNYRLHNFIKSQSNDQYDVSIFLENKDPSC